MNSIKSKSLAQIVTSNHQAAAVLEKYNLDFCCKGNRSLEQACMEKELPVDQIANELKGLTTPDPANNTALFNDMTLTQLADYIVLTHHVYVKKELPQIFNYLEKVNSKHGQRHPELKNIFQLFAAVKEELEGHMKKEELILFPRIKELEKLVDNPGHLKLNIGYLQSPILVMEQEHDHAGTLFNEIRILTNNYTPPTEACTTYRLSFTALQAFEADLHQHVHLENNILFPKAIASFKDLQGSVLN